MDWQLLHQISSKNISNENINTCVSVVFKTKRELKCRNKKKFWTHQFLCFHYWEFLFGTFDVIIDNPCIFDVVERLLYLLLQFILLTQAGNFTSNFAKPAFNGCWCIPGYCTVVGNWLNACQNCTTTWVTLQFATSRWAIFYHFKFFIVK